MHMCMACTCLYRHPCLVHLQIVGGTLPLQYVLQALIPVYVDQEGAVQAGMNRPKWVAATAVLLLTQEGQGCTHNGCQSRIREDRDEKE